MMNTWKILGLSEIIKKKKDEEEKKVNSVYSKPLTKKYSMKLASK